jgi:hypothetical protein
MTPESFGQPGPDRQGDLVCHHRERLVVPFLWGEVTPHLASNMAQCGGESVGDGKIVRVSN